MPILSLLSLPPVFLLSGSRRAKKTPELAAGGIKGSLLIFAAVIEKRAALLDHLEKVLFDRPLSQGRIVVEVANELPPASTCCRRVSGCSSATDPTRPDIRERDGTEPPTVHPAADLFPTARPETRFRRTAPAPRSCQIRACSITPSVTVRELTRASH